MPLEDLSSIDVISILRILKSLNEALHHIYYERDQPILLYSFNRVIIRLDQKYKPPKNRMMLLLRVQTDIHARTYAR